MAGLLVADFSRVLAGPLAAVGLADLGADVIKVERPGLGDDTRHWGPPWSDGTATYFASANRSKRSVELDLADPADNALARELARRADVVIENFRSGTLAAYGLGWEQVRAANPRAVYCSITGFGSGAGATLPGYDFLVQAVGGLMSITGPADGEPSKVGVALVDVLTSKDALVGILAALRARETSGVGQLVEVNLLSSLLGSFANQASGYLATGTPPHRMGNRHPSVAPYETLRCRDGMIAVCCGNDAQFARLATALGSPELAESPRFGTNGVRVAHRDELIPLLEEGLARDDGAAWVTRLGAVGVPAGQVGNLADAFALAEELGLEPAVEVGEGAPPQVRNPVRYSATPVTSYGPPPGLGEHNTQVREWLRDDGGPRGRSSSEVTPR